MKITLEVPDTLSEKEVAEWVKVKVERHLRAIEEAKVVSVDAIIKPKMDEYDEKNGLKVAEKVAEEQAKVEEIEKEL
jgi:hypothetical protein